MRYEQKPSSTSLHLVVFGLIAALVMSLAFPLISHIGDKDTANRHTPRVSTEHTAAQR